MKTNNQKGLALIFLLIGVVTITSIAVGVYYLKSTLTEPQVKVTSQATPTSIPTNVPSVIPIPQASPSETANWKLYENKNLGVSFKYPGDWDIISDNNDRVHLLKDPVSAAGVIGVCPGYSFSVISYHSYDRLLDLNYDRSKIQKGIVDNQAVEFTEGGVVVRCKSRMLFVNNYPTDEVKPRLIIHMVSDIDRHPLFDQVLATLKFTK